MKKEKICQIIKEKNIQNVNIFPYSYYFSVDSFNQIICTQRKYFGIVISKDFRNVDVNFEPLKVFIKANFQFQRYCNAIRRKETNLEPYKLKISNIFNQ